MKIESTRQKFEPILGPLINKPYTELLHNTNNAFQHIYAQLLREAEKKSDFPSNIKLGEPHKDCIIRILTYTLRSIKATHFFKKSENVSTVDVKDHLIINLQVKEVSYDQIIL